LASHSFIAFKWSGNYYNNVYDTSHVVTFTDDDDEYEGWGDSDERVSIDGGPQMSTWGSPYAIKVSFTDTDGEEHVETFDFFNAGGEWYFLPGPESAFTEGARLGSYRSHEIGWEYEDHMAPPCLVGGTLIATSRGEIAVEELRAGDRILLAGGGSRRLERVLWREVSPQEMCACPQLAPVRIAAGALGQGLPRRDLLLSRQHRMLVRSRIAERMFGCAEVLVAAAHLCAMPGIDVVRPRGAIRYHHLLLARHALILAEGAPSESFLLTPRSLASLPPRARAEVGELFPFLGADADFSPMPPAALLPPGRRQKALVHRHAANGKALLQPLRLGSVRHSMCHEDRDVGRLQHVPGCSAQNGFADSRMAVGTHHQKVGALVGQMAGDHL